MNTVFRRTFYTYEKASYKAYIKIIGRRGFIFSHDYIICSLNKPAIHMNDMGVFILSISKYCSNSLKELEEIKNSGELITIEFEQDVIGLPTKGQTFGPDYLTSFKRDTSAQIDTSNIQAQRDISTEEFLADFYKVRKNN